MNEENGNTFPNAEPVESATTKQTDEMQELGEGASDPQEQQPEGETQNTEKEKEEDDGAEPVDEPKGAKKETGAEKRIKALVSQRKRAEEEAAYYKQLAEERIRQGQQAQNPAEGKKAEPKQEDYETWDAYQEARDNYLIEKAKSEFRKEQEQFLQSQKTETAKQVFNKKLLSLREVNPEKYEKVYSLQVRTDIIKEIVESEDGLEIAEFLADNPEALFEVNQLSGSALQRKIGKFEAMLSATKEQRKIKNVSTAPPPITPNLTSKSVTLKSFDDMSIDEFIAYRNKKDFERRYGKRS